MNREIERKFLLPVYPSELIERGSLIVLSRKTIEQTYLALMDTEEIRVRKLTSSEGKEPVYTHTFKRGNGLSREEVEYEIAPAIYDQLLSCTGKAPLIKTRTKVQDGGFVFEIDEYHQYDLMTVEVEFAGEDEALRFAAPSWFGQEVGSQQEYRNKQLWASVQKQGE